MNREIFFRPDCDYLDTWGMMEDSMDSINLRPDFLYNLFWSLRGYEHCMQDGIGTTFRELRGESYDYDQNQFT